LDTTTSIRFIVLIGARRVDISMAETFPLSEKKKTL
jgi:hypothetical protein